MCNSVYYSGESECLWGGDYGNVGFKPYSPSIMPTSGHSADTSQRVQVLTNVSFLEMSAPGKTNLSFLDSARRFDCFLQESEDQS